MTQPEPSLADLLDALEWHEHAFSTHAETHPGAWGVALSLSGNSCAELAQTCGEAAARLRELENAGEGEDRLSNLSAPSPLPEANCCCAWGAAISGEWPEFSCRDCPQHGEPHEERLCKRHRRSQADPELAGFLNEWADELNGYEREYADQNRLRRAARMIGGEALEANPGGEK